MSEAKSYTGGCHCGAVKYQATLDLSAGPLIGCNCSICSKTGTLLAFVPATGFELLSGENELTDYQFGKKSIHHLFCRICGIRSFARGTMPDGTPMAAINVRCLDGVDAESLPVHRFDGRSL